MGYAFLYGVFGSLIGTNFGATLYDKMLQPIVPDAGLLASGSPLPLVTVSKLKTFWLIFTVLGAVCLAGMLLYNRFFAEDTPKSNRRARLVMMIAYGIIALVGFYFFVYSLFLTPQVQWKTFVQSIIMLGLGGGGIFTCTIKRE
ncbi:MAG: hypothetical protein JXB26_01990 [Candidatus Aminicenantes bacterium]|nr:hypothetical protein [Candidatus Aminicenantes bacterium]